MPEFHVHQSLPICIALASLGGVLEVAATAVTALPSVREQQGYLVSNQMRWLAVVGNVVLQMFGGLFSALLATWFGPVSIVVPFYYCATLLTNMIVFGLLLGTENFKKPMRVGTHVIVLAVILLPVVGPTVSPDQTFDELIQNHWYSILWYLILFLTTLVTGGILILHASPTDTNPETNRFLKDYTPMQRTIVLLLCRAATMSVDLTVSRCLVLNPPSKFIVAALIGTKLWSGNLCTYAIVVQSYSVVQGRYVPLNATMVIVVNALTGLLVWEDQPQSWYGYFCVFWLLGIGCDLLLSVPTLLTPENLEFGTNKSANILITEGRRKLTGDTEEIKKLVVIDTSNHNSSEQGLLNDNHDDNADDDDDHNKNADTPKRKGYQSITNASSPPPPSRGNEGTPQSERDQQQQQLHPTNVSGRPHYPAATNYDETDDLDWEYDNTTKNPIASPLTPTTPAAATTTTPWDPSLLLWNNNVPHSPEEGSHSTMSSREAWSEVILHRPHRRRTLSAGGGGDHHHFHHYYHHDATTTPASAYYFDTRGMMMMGRQGPPPPRIPSPPPPNQMMIIPRIVPAGSSIPTIPSGHNLVLETPTPSSLTFNDEHQAAGSSSSNGNRRRATSDGPCPHDKTATSVPPSLLGGSDGETGSY